MTVAMLEAPSAMSLEQVLRHAWSALARGESVECPVCQSDMHPRWTAGAGVAGGRCEDCGATLE